VGVEYWSCGRREKLLFQGGAMYIQTVPCLFLCFFYFVYRIDCVQAVELKPGGEDENVTIHNVEDYIERTIGTRELSELLTLSPSTKRIIRVGS
jgi:hypothetical protein